MTDLFKHSKERYWLSKCRVVQFLYCSHDEAIPVPNYCTTNYPIYCAGMFLIPVHPIMYTGYWLLISVSLTTFTLCSCPSQDTGASISSCTGSTILTRIGAGGCNRDNYSMYKVSSRCSSLQCTVHARHTCALRHTPTPLSIRLAGSVV